MIKREIAPHLVGLFRQYPFVTLTGPRQSGKTTLCRAAFPALDYLDLDLPRHRRAAVNDPEAFLRRLGGGAILDEVQRAPDLFPCLKVLADETRRNGMFVLTGSEQFAFSARITESLAGRTAILRLLPFSLAELERTGASDDIADILYSGFYPRIHDQGLEPRQALRDYFDTYIERDVRQVAALHDLAGFRRFVGLCAARVGQLTNLTALGADARVSRATALRWLTVLEASYIAFRLPPFFASLRKRLVRMPKLYFCDVGLASHLLGVESAADVRTHPMRGALFENAVVMEALKHRFHSSRRSNLSFFRDADGLECDLLYENGRGLCAIEIKSGVRIDSDRFRGLDRIAATLPRVGARVVVYGGTEPQRRREGEVVPLAGLREVLQRFDGEPGAA